jgi:hypothetical protein
MQRPPTPTRSDWTGALFPSDGFLARSAGVLVRSTGVLVRSTGVLARPACASALIIVALAACDVAPEPLEPAATAVEITPAAGRGHGGDHVKRRVVRKWLAQLKRRTARYERFDVAVRAGYDSQITPCMEQEGDGGMGFHYGDTDLINDIVEPLKPELLLYEPQKNGRLRFVAVEYIVPFDAWTAAEPPAIHGIPFHRNEGFGLWVLHVWIDKHNPSGIFMDWNPKVSCRFAE